MKDNIKIECKYIHDHNHIKQPLVFDDLLLFQIGEIFYDNNAVCEAHYHDNFFEFSFIESGTGIFISDNIRETVKKGDIHISLPFEKHEIISDSYEPLRYFYLTIGLKEGTEFWKILNDTLLNKNLHNKRVVPSQRSDINDLFVDLLSCYENQTELRNQKFVLLCKLFVVSVLELYENNHVHKYVKIKPGSEETIYYQIMNYIDTNLLSINNLTEIAKKLKYNYSYISRIFKKKFGSTIQEYYSNQKITLAKKLLEEGQMSLTSISSYLNFSSLYIFSRSFKNAVGVSPKAYQSTLSVTKKVSSLMS